MSKDTNFIGQPIFSQLLNFVSKSEIDTIASKNNADRYTKKFTTYNHLVVMLYSVFEGVSSLREAVIPNWKQNYQHILYLFQFFVT